MQIMNRGEKKQKKKNTKSLSPTQFSQTQDIPVGKHQQQKHILQKKASLLRDRNVNNANSQKRTCYTPEIKHWGWRFNKGTSQGCSLEVFPSPDSRGCNRTSGSSPKQSQRTVLTHRAADADLSGRVLTEAERCPNSKVLFLKCSLAETDVLQSVRPAETCTDKYLAAYKWNQRMKLTVILPWLQSDL